MAFNWFKKKAETEKEREGQALPSQPKNCGDDRGKAETPQASSGFFNRLKDRLSGSRRTFSGGLEKIFAGKRQVDQDLLDELEELLITSDIGVQTTAELMEKISGRLSRLAGIEDVKEALKTEILALMDSSAVQTEKKISGPRIVMVVGVNGVGKTTTIGKLAARHAAQGQKILIAAADTFRAAAIEQLTVWAERARAEIVRHQDKADPSAVVYDAVEAALARNADMVLIDTAGRLHTKKNLMEELKKIKRTISRKIPEAPHEVLLVLDATTGQNALTQARMFHDELGVTGIALAKLDGTAKGGIAVAISGSLKIPLRYIGIGESIEDLQDFDPVRYVHALF